jgi:hypothetical protein
MLKQKTRLQHAWNLKGNVLHDIDIVYFDTKLYFVLNLFISLKYTGRTELELTDQPLFSASFLFMLCSALTN